MMSASVRAYCHTLRRLLLIIRSHSTTTNFSRRHQSLLLFLLPVSTSPLFFSTTFTCVYEKERIFIWKRAIECLECCSWAHLLRKNLLKVAPKEYAKECNSIHRCTVDGTYGAQSLHFTSFSLALFLFSLYHMMALCNVCFTIACFSRFLRAKIAKKTTFPVFSKNWCLHCFTSAICPFYLSQNRPNELVNMLFNIFKQIQ